MPHTVYFLENVKSEHHFEKFIFFKDQSVKTPLHRHFMKKYSIALLFALITPVIVYSQRDNSPGIDTFEQTFSVEVGVFILRSLPKPV